VTLVLASASPRRRELLASLGLRFLVAPSGVDEDGLATGRAPEDAAVELAVAKARAAARRDAVVLGADTMVVLDGRVLGKPASDEEAFAMLAALRGRTHRVLTGVAVVAPAGETTRLVESEVRMRAYRDEEIATYVASGDGRDKAGGYAIQSETLRPVEAIGGCWCNVMGLPLWAAYVLLCDAGLLAPHGPDRAYARCAACPLSRGAR
jgi:septum formation protein